MKEETAPSTHCRGGWVSSRARLDIMENREVSFRDIGFSDFIHRPGIKNKLRKNTTFRKLDLFPSSGEGKTYSVGSLRKS
jgi:hypothetical protein